MKVFNAAGLPDRDFEEILSFLRAGGVIGFPTDTAYGLGADAFNAAAIRRIFAIKGRAGTKAILILVNSMDMLRQAATVPEDFPRLAERFWPGPLTVVLPAAKTLPAALTAGGGTIGIRWPAAPFAEKLLAALGRPVTATSANQSGMPAADNAEAVRLQLGDRLDILVDGGTLPEPGGSTVLDLTRKPPVLLRDGPIGFETLNAFIAGGIRRSDATSMLMPAAPEAQE